MYISKEYSRQFSMYQTKALRDLVLMIRALEVVRYTKFKVRKKETGEPGYPDVWAIYTEYRE